MKNRTPYKKIELLLKFGEIKFMRKEDIEEYDKELRELNFTQSEMIKYDPYRPLWTYIPFNMDEYDRIIQRVDFQDFINTVWDVYHEDFETIERKSLK